MTNLINIHTYKKVTIQFILAYSLKCLNMHDQVIQTYDHGLMYCNSTNKILRCKGNHLAYEA